MLGLSKDVGDGFRGSSRIDRVGETAVTPYGRSPFDFGTEASGSVTCSGTTRTAPLQVW